MSITLITANLQSCYDPAFYDIILFSNWDNFRERCSVTLMIRCWVQLGLRN